ncbi:hypothetical protein OGAPHI_001335 [Ogataea philodendri]|uniref:Uracil permease n=1 Tax=Ogataea philodendri TaxID=1378263 RepID=A0A9P8T869_9ASCO|nr:uncharacterized protein OGAPHI_001335 [Ogataea philodendri]KAH3669214.1 hypothetical protein OGAPHI_001335 [Ogataea philodendri]
MSAWTRLKRFAEVKNSGADGVPVTPWINHDIVPLPPSRRKWDVWTFMGFWAINNLCISNYQVGSTLIAIGNSVWMAMLANILGRIIICLMACFNGQVGAEYHIGYPVFSRAIWGMKGSYIAIIQRIMLGVVWLSTQSWTGGLCISTMLSALAPGYQNMENKMAPGTHMTTKEFTGFVIYCVLMCGMIYVPPEKSARLLTTLNTMTGVTLFGMMVYCLSAAHGGGPLLSAPATASNAWDKGWAIMAGIKTTIGTIAVGLTNQPDYNRFARNHKDPLIGQIVAIMFYGSVVPLMGCLTTSASAKLYPDTDGGIWNPPLLAARWLDDDYNAKSRAGAFFCGLGLLAGQLAINTVDNAFSAGMDFSGLFPKYLTLKRGAYLGLCISILLQPWQLLSTAGVFINVMSAYAVLLGAMTGIMVCDYWVVRKRKLRLTHLFTPDRSSIYWFTGGFNWRSFAAWVIGFAPLMPGFINACNSDIKIPSGATHLYQLAFLYGFVVSFLLHYLFNVLSPPTGLGEVDTTDPFGTFTYEEAQRLGIHLQDTLDDSQTIDDSPEKVGKESFKISQISV